MSRITITIAIDVPDDAHVSVGSTASQAAEAPPPPASAAPANGAVVDGPRGECPKHLKPWRDGRKGPYCSAKDDHGHNGYCSLRPGDIYNGKRAIA